MRPLLALASIALFGAAPAAALADIVKLKNGETIEGIVVSKDDKYVTIAVPCGELGFDASLVDSIDAKAGPTTKEDLTALRDAARRRAAEQDAQREMAVARREAAVAAEAAARRESPEAEADAEARPTLTSDESVQIRIEAFEEALNSIVSRREREKLRRELVNYYFGPSFDPILHLGL